jgi:hypothetical protein
MAADGSPAEGPALALTCGFPLRRVHPWCRNESCRKGAIDTKLCQRARPVAHRACALEREACARVEDEERTLRSSANTRVDRDEHAQDDANRIGDVKAEH